MHRRGKLSEDVTDDKKNKRTEKNVMQPASDLHTVASRTPLFLIKKSCRRGNIVFSEFNCLILGQAIISDLYRETVRCKFCYVDKNFEVCLVFCMKACKWLNGFNLVCIFFSFLKKSCLFKTTGGGRVFIGKGCIRIYFLRIVYRLFNNGSSRKEKIT